MAAKPGATADGSQYPGQLPELRRLWRRLLRVYASCVSTSMMPGLAWPSLPVPGDMGPVKQEQNVRMAVNDKTRQGRYNYQCEQITQAFLL